MGEIIKLFEPRRFKSFRALHDEVIVCDMAFTETITRMGIYIPNDNGTGAGIRARWGRVWAVGPEQTTVRVGEWVMVEHGRWTRGVEVYDDSGKIITIRKIDKKCIMLTSEEFPAGVVGVSDKVDERQKFM